MSKVLNLTLAFGQSTTQSDISNKELDYCNLIERLIVTINSMAF